MSTDNIIDIVEQDTLKRVDRLFQMADQFAMVSRQRKMVRSVRKFCRITAEVLREVAIEQSKVIDKFIFLETERGKLHQARIEMETELQEIQRQKAEMFPLPPEDNE